MLDLVRDALGRIELDPCTTPDNPVDADLFYAPPEHDGAELPWDAQSIFVNPPYGKARERWVRRCIEAGKEGKRVVLLMPAATDTRIFQEALTTATEVVFVRGRLKFGVLRPNRRQVAASHPSALIGWNAQLRITRSLGVYLRLGQHAGQAGDEMGSDGGMPAEPAAWPGVTGNWRQVGPTRYAVSRDGVHFDVWEAE